MTKYCFKVVYANRILQDIAELMSKLELEIYGIAMECTFTFLSINDIPIDLLKEKISQAFEANDFIVRMILGSKVE